MTEYEISELLYSIIDSMATLFSAYLTIISGYLIIAYLVGARLEKVQVVIINSLFIAITAIQLYSMFTYSLELGALIQRKAEISELTQFQSLIMNQASNFATVFLMFLGVCASLYFFYSVRRKSS